MFAGPNYGPKALKVMVRAYDKAWRSVAGNFGSDPQSIKAGRLKLADALLSVATERSRDVDALKNAALEVMAREFDADHGGWR
jgi:hypothetical protein